MVGRTDYEKDPAYLALQVKKLKADFEELAKAENDNLEGIRRAFAMSDVHQQVLLRLSHDFASALVQVRKLQVDGDVTLSKCDFGDVKLHDEGTLNLGAYYEEYRKVAELAGSEHADVAVIIWSKGVSPEEAVERAKLSKTQQVAQESQDSDADYEVEYFGGNSGQNHQQQEPQAASADG